MTEASLKTFIIPAQPSICEVVAEPNSLSRLPEYLGAAGLQGKAFVITDSMVAELHGPTVLESLDHANIESHMLVMPPGEASKSWEQTGDFIDELARRKATRKDFIIGLGGGVVTDEAGFTAAIYNRGVSWVSAPTTLLGMVDAGLGGKTGIDKGGKNKTGRIEHPRLVVADPSTLATLEHRAYLQGLAEIAKYGILDASFMEQLEPVAESIREFSVDNLDVLRGIIDRCITMKMGYVVRDPDERKPRGRILLNYGHSLAHGLEAASDFGELWHGEAVAIGITYAALLGLQLRLSDTDILPRQMQLLEKLGLLTSYTGDAKPEDVLEHMSRDKKNSKKGYNRMVLPRSVGRMSVRQIDNQVIETSVREFLTAV